MMVLHGCVVGAGGDILHVLRAGCVKAMQGLWEKVTECANLLCMLL